MSEKLTTVTVAESGIGRYVQTVTASNHKFMADEPLGAGGDDKGPAPYDLLLASLGTCTSMTLRMYAARKEWPVEKISVVLTHHKEDGADIITRDISVTGNLDEAQRQRLLEIANKCPVHKTLEKRTVDHQQARIMTHTADVEKSRDIILKKIGGLKPKVAVILGSGLGGLADKIEKPARISYGELPGFPALTVQGHVGEVVAGKLNGTDVMVLKGRKHFYETDDAYPLKTMIRAMKASGVETLFVSGAVGSLRGPMGVSSLMLITDHINLMGFHPLTGPNDDAFGPRFFAMNDAWDPKLQQVMKDAARKNSITLDEGVYIALRGPSFETPAEIRMIQGLGGDAVGMSVVPDCIIARHCGLKVVGAAVITNMGAGLSDEKLSHAHTLENAGKGAADFERLVTEALPHL